MSTVIDATRVPSTAMIIKYRLPLRMFLSTCISSILQIQQQYRKAMYTTTEGKNNSAVGIISRQSSITPPLKIYAYACIIVSERVYYLTVLHKMHDRHTMLLLHQSTCKGAYLQCFHLMTLTIIPQSAQSIVQHVQRAVEKSSMRRDIETRICFRKLMAK